MSDPPSNNEPTPQRRRMSIADMFNPRASTASSPPAGASAPASNDTTQHRRGVSITTLGLAGTGNTQPSPYTAFARQRRASISTSSAASSPEFKNSFGDEHAVIEEDDPGRASYGGPPSPSFARRVSFGAQALKDVRQSGGGALDRGRSPSSSSPALYTLDEDSSRTAHPSSRSFETAKARGESFNWSEALRDRTKRSPSFSSGNPFASSINRTKSMSATAAAAPEPPRDMPKSPPPPAKTKKPDHLGERMLRGDFMMD